MVGETTVAEFVTLVLQLYVFAPTAANVAVCPIQISGFEVVTVSVGKGLTIMEVEAVFEQLF